VWYFGDTPKARVNLKIKSSGWRTYSSKRIKTNDVGAWRVDVLGPNGELLRTLRFRIIPKDKQVSSAPMRFHPSGVILFSA
jgi:hypothetical protein